MAEFVSIAFIAFLLKTHPSFLVEEAVHTAVPYPQASCSSACKSTRSQPQKSTSSASNVTHDWPMRPSSD